MESNSPNHSRKKRHSKACTRCRKRKIRCDFQYPSCGACSTAGATCLGFDSVHETSKPRSTIAFLENEVARLEIELGRTKTQTKSTSDNANTAVERLTTELAFAVLEPSSYSRKQESLLPLTPTLFLSSSPIPYLSSRTWDGTETVENQEDPHRAIAISTIPRHVIDIMLKNYCEMYRPRYPAVEDSDLHEACERVYNNAKPSEFDCFCTYITLAISTNTLMHHDEKRAKRASRGFWASAVIHLEQIGLSASWERLQALQLLTHYGFLNPQDVDCSTCAAAATRLCLQLGLHHELPLSAHVKLDSTTLNTRRRLFWNSYSIDSAVHSMRCRPFLWPVSAFTAKFPNSNSKSSPGIHIFLLRQIESEITLALYYPSFYPEDLSSDTSFGQWHKRMHERLNDWHQATRQSVNLTEKIEFHELLFHVQMLRLNRPSPRCPTPTKIMRQKALKSSIAIIKEFSVIDRLGRLFNMWHAAYHIIESGVCLLASVLTGMGSASKEFTHLDGEDVSLLTRYTRTFSHLLGQLSRRWINVAKHASVLEGITHSVLERLEQWSGGKILDGSAFYELEQELNRFSLFPLFPLATESLSRESVLPELNSYGGAEPGLQPNHIALQPGEKAAPTMVESEQYYQPGVIADSMSEAFRTLGPSGFQIPASDHRREEVH